MVDFTGQLSCYSQQATECKVRDCGKKATRTGPNCAPSGWVRMPEEDRSNNNCPTLFISAVLGSRLVVMGYHRGLRLDTTLGSSVNLRT